MNTSRTPSNALRSAGPILEIVNSQFHLGLSKLRGSAPHNVIIAVAEIQKSEFISVTYSRALRRHVTVSCAGRNLADSYAGHMTDAQWNVAAPVVGYGITGLRFS
jgi:hypothetical protein